MNAYKVTAPRAVLDVEPGDVLEHDFTEAEERDLLAAGRLEIVPRQYEVVGSSRVNDTDPGGTFSAALTVGQEAALVAAGHIERVAPKPKAKPAEKPAAATTTKEEK